LDGPLAIIGYMGSGKSTIGHLAARKLGWEFVDLDREIVRRTGCNIAGIFERSGERRFRDLEHEALLAALGGPPERVVACGGGVILRPENRARLREVATVFLEENTGILYERTRGGSRPLRAARLDEFERRYAQRLPYYVEVADLRLAVQGRPKEQISEEIIQWLSE
jgi:shikimate kinase